MNEKIIEKELKMLYKHFPEISKLLRKLGCNESLTEDIFQDALIIYLNRKENEHFEFKLEPIYYVKQTCKYLWYKEARKSNEERTAVEELVIDSISTKELDQELKYKKLETALSQLGKKCQELLQLFYGLNLSMQQIAAQLGFRNAEVAKTQKYRCLEKAKGYVQEVKLSLESIK